jgi:hypothetical protein
MACTRSGVSIETPYRYWCLPISTSSNLSSRTQPYRVRDLLLLCHEQQIPHVKPFGVTGLEDRYLRVLPSINGLHPFGCLHRNALPILVFAYLNVLKFVIPNPALSGEGSAFVMPRTADPSHEAVRDDRFRGYIFAGITEHKWLAPVRVSPSKRLTDTGVCLFQRPQICHPEPSLIG